MNTTKDEYRDIRADFWKEHFQLAEDYETYLRESKPELAAKWRNMAGNIPPLSASQVDRLRNITGRRLSLLVYSGVWCGDCVRQGPMLKQVADAAGSIDLRIIDREASAALTEELRILGARRVPVAVFLSEDFFEIGRFGDRLLTVYRAKAATALGPTCDTGLIPPPAERLGAERDEWVDIFERMLLMARLSPPLRDRHGD
ncbi:MAG TPA: thioredoxin family protein [Blastocatellia bacterium]